MYSNFDTEADVIFVTDQKDRVLPMEKVFRSGSSTAKKAYKKELGKITAKTKRDTKQATAPERAAVDIDDQRQVLAILRQVEIQLLADVPVGDVGQVPENHGARGEAHPPRMQGLCKRQG